MIDCVAPFMGEPVQSDEIINCHHNYTNQEKHFGKSVLSEGAEQDVDGP